VSFVNEDAVRTQALGSQSAQPNMMALMAKLMMPKLSPLENLPFIMNILQHNEVKESEKR
jgi:hypothetical protein